MGKDDVWSTLLFLFLCFLGKAREGFGKGNTAEIEELSESESMMQAYNLSLLINKVLDGYDIKTRPNAGGPPVVVSVEFKVISFGEIKEVNMEYTLDIFLRQWWYDPKFKNNFTQPFTMAADPAKLFWTPDTYFWNVKRSKYHYVTRDNRRIMIHPDGKVYYSARITLTAQCDMDLRLYPMDTQKCPLIIESYAYTTADVDYRWKGNSPGIEIVSSEMAQFDLVGIKKRTKASRNSKGAYARLTAFFFFQRRLEHFVSSVFVPAVVLVLLSWCCFFISPSAVPARISLSITTILTTILLQGAVNSNMPKVSYMKAIDYFLLTSFGFIFAALVEYVLVLNTNAELLKFVSSVRNFLSRFKICSPTKRVEDELEMDEFQEDCDSSDGELVIKIMDDGVCKLKKRKGSCRLRSSTSCVHKVKYSPEEKKTQRKIHWIDYIARIVFPFGYSLYLIGFLVYYTSMRD